MNPHAVGARLGRLAALLLASLFSIPSEARPPSIGVRAVPTYESVGLYWTDPTGNSKEGCAVRYRKAGASAWSEGHPLWYDARNDECRGSLVHLTPGTSYEVELGAAKSWVRGVVFSTWSDALPIARVIEVPSGGATLRITEGGTPAGYVVYQGAPGAVLDAQDLHINNVELNASYVIVRGLTLLGAQRDAIRISPSVTDVVIEDNAISGWGRPRVPGATIGLPMDSAIRAVCNTGPTLQRVTIQRNRIRDPRYPAQPWGEATAAGGPQGITFTNCGGNHVIRHNEIASDDPRRYFNDALGGEENFSDGGFPNRDSDIYRNRISGAWDDAIEAEGANMNVRIWGNAIDRAAIGIATAVTHRGPLYVFGNEHRHSRRLSEKPPEADDRGPMIKAGDVDRYGGGRRYIFDNKGYDVAHGISGSTKQPLTNTVSRNNEWKLFRRHWPAVRDAGGSGNDIQDGRKVRIPNFHESARGDNG
jgi:hypothetical protein